ncbi:uncharacterized protein LOC118435761 [Folsomia candida]|uniref:Uncharacterized protein n=1 Tax=Folsomia candida TaxID=158441 RepID=A0A226EAQ1_FOLCA|nr:uncharacterized protein LOC118435761 [Folsomia candida]OXA53891.1 hypothetical protein Fcan01_10386 [Folsomia candida]
MIVMCILFFSTVPWTTVLHYFLFPDTPILLPTVLPPRWRYSSLVYWGYSFVPMYYAFGIWQEMWIVSLLVVVYIFSILPLINCEFRVGPLKHKSSPELRSSVWNLTAEYRRVEVMHQLFLDIIGSPLLVLQFAFGQFSLFCNVSVIHGRDSMDTPTKLLLILWSLTMQIMWILVLETSGYFREYAKTTLRSWKQLSCASREEKSYFSKFRRGCRPLKIGTGGVFTITRLSSPKFMRSIIRGTFRALLIRK